MTSCAAFGEAEARKIVEVAARLKAVGRERTAAALIAIGWLTYDGMLGTAGLPLEYSAALYRGAADVLAPTLAAELRLSEEDARLAMLRLQHAIAAAILEEGMVLATGDDRGILARTIFSELHLGEISDQDEDKIGETISFFHRVVAQSVSEGLATTPLADPGPLADQLFPPAKED